MVSILKRHSESVLSYIQHLSSKKLILLCVLLALIAYSNALDGYFIWDDYPDIYHNSSIRQFDVKAFTASLHQEDSSALVKVPLYFRPLQLLTYMVDYRLWGLNSFGFHLTNSILHALTTALLYIFIALFFNMSIWPFLGAAFFATNPVFTSSVTYISGRADILALLFLLLSCLLFYKAVARQSVQCFYYFVSLAAFLLALYAKEIAIAGAVSIFLLSTFMYRWHGKRKLFFLYIPYIFLIAGFFLTKPAALAGWQRIAGVSRNPIFDLLTIFKGIFLYTQLAVFPVQLRMGRSMAAIASVTDAWFYAAIGVLIVVIFLLRYGIRKNRIFLFGLSSFFVPLFSLLLFNNLLARRADEILLPEHNLYFTYPGLLIALLASLEGFPMKTRLRHGILVVAIAFIPLNTILTLMTNNHWKDEIPFYERTITLNKGSLFNYLPYANLAAAYEKQKDIEKAERNYRDAVKNAGNNPYFYNMLAAFYIRQHDFSKAIEALTVSKGLDPRFSQTSFLLGIAYLSKGNIGEAKNYLEQLRLSHPEDTVALEHLAGLIEREEGMAHGD